MIGHLIFQRMMYWHKLLDVLALTKAKIVVTDLIPVIENRYTDQASLIRCNADVERYNQIIKKICKERNVSFFARYDKWKAQNLEELYKDAIHPNAKGQQIMAEELYAYLSQNKIL